MRLKRLPVQFYNAYRLWRHQGTRVLARAVAEELNRTWGFRIPLPPAPPSPPDPDEAYRAWVARTDPGPERLAWQRAASKRLPYRPLISLLTPVYNPPPDVLRDTLESVRAQTYDNWELCLADASSDPAVRAVLDEYAGRDPRVRVNFLGRNEGISGNSNHSLAMAGGEFVAIVDHDDTLSPHALYEVVRELNRDETIDLVYFDEDKVSADGTQRREPWFKPGWGPELLLASNPLMHSVMRARLARAGGGFAPEAEGAQDWDLALRVTPECRRIAHVPKVLYHWRKISTSVAGNLEAKPYAFPAQFKCLARHLERLGRAAAVVDSPELGRYRLRWAHPRPKVSVLIPTKDKVGLLRRCLDTLLGKTDYPDFEVVVVDTGSAEAATHDYYRSLAGEARVRLVHFAGEFNYSRANNFAARHAAGDVLVFLNNDTEVLDGSWLDELVQWALLPGVGAVGGKLLYPDGSVQHAGIVMFQSGGPNHPFRLHPNEHATGVFGSASWYRNYLAVTGACLAVPRAVFDEVGGFNEEFGLLFGDVDLCLKVGDSGRRVVYNPYARLVHHENASHGGAVPVKDLARLGQKMGPLICGEDPYYNPNLSYTEKTPAVAGAAYGPRVDSLHALLRPLGVDRDVRLPHAAGGYPRLLAAHRLSDTSAVRFPAPEPCAGRLLFLSPGLESDGVGLVLYHLAEHLRGRGYAVTVASHRAGPLLDAYDAAGLPAVVNPLVAGAPYALPDLFEAGDAVLAAGAVMAPAVVAAASAGKRPLWLVAEARLAEDQPEGGRAIAEALARAAAVLVPSAKSAEALARFGPPSRTHVVPFGLAAGTWPAPTADGGAPRLLHFLDVLDPAGLSVVLHAVRALPRSVRAATALDVSGQFADPWHEADVANRVRRGGGGRVWNDLTFAEGEARLRDADVVVCTSVEDAARLPVLAALAAGRCVVATPSSGVAEYLQDGVTGFVARGAGPRPLADVLLRLAREPGLRRRAAEAAATRFRLELSVERLGDRILELLRIPKRTHHRGTEDTEKRQSKG